MTTKEALQALECFTNVIPGEALNHIRAGWPEAEPVLLEELDWRIEHPYAKDRSARFLYALFLCGEMKSQAAFERYLAMARLPEMMLDRVLGDILTDSLSNLLKAPADDRRKNSRKNSLGREPGRNDPCPCGSGINTKNAASNRGLSATKPVRQTQVTGRVI